MGTLDKILTDADHDFEAAVAHTFFAGLLDGTLPKEVFLTFLHEDCRFLIRQSRVIARLASRCEELDLYAPLAGMAAGLPSALDLLYAPLLDKLGSSVGVALSGSLNGLSETYHRATAGYAAEAPVMEGIAFVLGFLMHHEIVGDRLRERHKDIPQTVYGDWVRTWGANPSFRMGAQAVREGFERLAESASADAIEGARRAFLLCSRYEVLFWDMFIAPREPRGPAFPLDMYAPR